MGYIWEMNNVNQSQNLFSNNTYYNTDGYYINYLEWDNRVYLLCRIEPVINTNL